MNLRVPSPLLVWLFIAVAGCASASKFRAGDYIKPIGSEKPEDVLKVVALLEDSYRVWTHSQDGNRLIVRKDSLDLSRARIDRDYERAEPPEVDGSFSIDEGFKGIAR